MPEVFYHKNFNHFIREKLPAIDASTQKIIAHPVADAACCTPLQPDQIATVAIGPEGGFTPEEVAVFREQHYLTVHLGVRILKVEIAVPVILAKLSSDY